MDQLFPADAGGETLSNSISSVQGIGRWADRADVGLQDTQGFIAYGNGGENVIYVPIDNTYIDADAGGDGLGLPPGQNPPGGSFGGGIGAVSNFPSSYNHTFFSPNGLSRVTYDAAVFVGIDPPTTTNQYESVESISDWSNQISSTLGSIGATTWYEVGGQYFEVVANGEGTLYMIRGISDGLEDWKGPFPF